VTSICLFVLCSPDTQTYIQKLEKEKRDKAAGQTQDNRSFLAKYVSTLYHALCTVSCVKIGFNIILVTSVFFKDNIDEKL